MRVKDQVWFSLLSAPDFLFGAVYITPCDAPYFSHESFSAIQEQTVLQGEKLVIIGDFNAHMPSLDTSASVRYGSTYNSNPDTVSNANGRDLFNLCDNSDWIFINYLNRGRSSMGGGLTHLKGARDISQLHWAICSVSAIQFLDSWAICSVSAIHFLTVLKWTDAETCVQIITRFVLLYCNSKCVTMNCCRNQKS